VVLKHNIQCTPPGRDVLPWIAPTQHDVQLALSTTPARFRCASSQLDDWTRCYFWSEFYPHFSACEEPRRLRVLAISKLLAWFPHVCEISTIRALDPPWVQQVNHNPEPAVHRIAAEEVLIRAAGRIKCSVLEFSMPNFFKHVHSCTPGVHCILCLRTTCVHDPS
jgi:hypothetical protein